VFKFSKHKKGSFFLLKAGLHQVYAENCWFWLVMIWVFRKEKPHILNEEKKTGLGQSKESNFSRCRNRNSTQNDVD